MTCKKIFALIFCVAMLPNAFANSSCSLIANHPQVSNVDLVACVCDQRLKNLIAPLREPFRVIAACEMRWDDRNGVRKIDLAKERVFLDRFTKGDYPVGQIFVSGETIQEGTLRYEPGPAGEYSFTPELSFLAPSKVHDGGGFPFDAKFTDEKTLGLIKVPKKFTNSECYEAKASVKINGYRVLVGGQTDEAGLWFDSYKIVKIADYKPCKRQ